MNIFWFINQSLAISHFLFSYLMFLTAEGCNSFEIAAVRTTVQVCDARMFNSSNKPGLK